jgi:hypothetical protein
VDANRILKSGCKIEKLQLTCEKRYGPCLALYLIIAWRILYITLLSRFEPFFSRIEWQSICLVTKKEKPPDSPPSLRAILFMVANLWHC